MAQQQCHYQLMSNKPQKYIHCSLEMLNTRKMEFYTFIFLNI